MDGSEPMFWLAEKYTVGGLETEIVEHACFVYLLRLFSQKVHQLVVNQSWTVHTSPQEAWLRSSSLTDKPSPFRERLRVRVRIERTRSNRLRRHCCSNCFRKWEDLGVETAASASSPCLTCRVGKPTCLRASADGEPHGCGRQELASRPRDRNSANCTSRLIRECTSQHPLKRPDQPREPALFGGGCIPLRSDVSLLGS